MFKPGEEACIRATGEKVEVLRSLPDREVLTSVGVRKEAELRPSHPSVLLAGTWKSPEVHAAEVHAEWAQKERVLDPDAASYKDRDRVEGKLEKAKLDLDYCGHWTGGQDVEHLGFCEGRIFSISRDVSAADLQALEDALDSGTASSRWVPVTSALATTARCPYCYARIAEATNGKVLRVAEDSCPHPKGFAPLQWELNVPSGRIVVADNLLKWFPLPEGDHHIKCVNSTIGCRETSLEYAANGLAHGYVGNSCPGVYRLAKGSYTIAQRAKGKKRVASISTSLWWYSVCDADEFALRTQRFGGDLEEAGATVVEVPPGVYQFTQPDHETSDQEVHANFKWVRAPEAPTPFLEKWTSLEINAHAYVQAAISRRSTKWSDLTDMQRQYAWGEVAGRLLDRAEEDMHEKGFLVARVDSSVPDIDPPEFRYATSWYPCAGYFGDDEPVSVPKSLAPSFAKLLFRALESIISFGCSGFGYTSKLAQWQRERVWERNRMGYAVSLYRALMGPYGQFADPEYVAWLSEPLRAEDWVASFPLETP